MRTPSGYCDRPFHPRLSRMQSCSCPAAAPTQLSRFDPASTRAAPSDTSARAAVTSRPRASPANASRDRTPQVDKRRVASTRRAASQANCQPGSREDRRRGGARCSSRPRAAAMARARGTPTSITVPQSSNPEYALSSYAGTGGPAPVTAAAPRALTTTTGKSAHSPQSMVAPTSERNTAQPATCPVVAETHQSAVEPAATTQDPTIDGHACHVRAPERIQ